ncbi:MAG: MinD/ParA family protein [Clostridiales bacterium]|nr:MinD/ParA family protein [Clostridiales bacterium]
MDKLNVVVISDDIDTKIRIKNLIDGEKFAVSGFFEYNELTVLKILGRHPDVVILSYEGDGKSALQVAEQVYSELRGAALIMLAGSVDMEMLSNAMQRGVRQVLPLTVTSEELGEALVKACSLEKKRGFENEQPRIKSRVISFFSGKDGTGKTTLAVNTAVALALQGKKTLIIDADLQFGDVAVLLDLDPQDTIYELARDVEEMNIDVVKSVLTMHKSGLELLAAPKSPELAEYIHDKTLEVIINTVRPYYEFIVIDLAPGFGDISIAAIENSDIVNFVASVDILSLKNAKISLGILDALRQKEKVGLILNRAAQGIISKADFEKVLSLAPVVCLPEDKEVLSSINKGVPFVTGAPRSAAAKAITAYVNTLCEVQ